ncbi:MAG TPA: TetR/AcrR family transcriptional regulator [Solirubrobacteraceae bacterium]|nr:TetR/AcrR family transcriptional regulator [Solirubrobacteraceae bacterium]
MASTTTSAEIGTRERILDIAERLVQTRGFNGFSYADVAAELGITKASLHYHFPGKSELGDALVGRYTERFSEQLARIDAGALNPRAKLAAYAALYADVLRADRMCLCGMLAAEYETLPPAMRDAILRFFDDNQDWLEAVMEEGRADRSMRFEGTAHDGAGTILGGLEGALLVARPYHDVARFEAAATRLIAGVTGAG